MSDTQDAFAWTEPVKSCGFKNIGLRVDGALVIPYDQVINKSRRNPSGN